MTILLFLTQTILERPPGSMTTLAFWVHQILPKGMLICCTVCIFSDYTAYRWKLHIVDVNNKLMALLVTHAQEDLKHQLDILVTILQGLLPKFKDGDSAKDFLKFLALHFSWYFRYGKSVSLWLSFLLYLSDSLSLGWRSTLWCSPWLSGKGGKDRNMVGECSPERALWGNGSVKKSRAFSVAHWLSGGHLQIHSW